MANQQKTIEQIKDILEQMRPAIQSDGGDIEFVKFQDGIVYVRLLGACVGCPVAVYTLKLGVEQGLKEKIPEVREVVEIDSE